MFDHILVDSLDCGMILSATLLLYLEQANARYAPLILDRGDARRAGRRGSMSEVKHKPYSTCAGYRDNVGGLEFKYRVPSVFCRPSSGWENRKAADGQRSFRHGQAIKRTRVDDQYHRGLAHEGGAQTAMCRV